jgi:competence protein ComGC
MIGGTQITRRKIDARGGFTVREFAIIVIVIGVVIAILIPLIIGNIRLAREKGEIEETRTVTITIQTLLSIANSEGVTAKELNAPDDSGYFHTDPERDDNMTLTGNAYAAMEDLARIRFGYVDQVQMKDVYSLVSFRYRTPNGSIVQYKDGVYTVLELYTGSIRTDGEKTDIDSVAGYLDS